MPTINQLLTDHDLSEGQRFDMLAAYDESPEGFESVCVRAAGAKRPTGYLITMIRSGAHLEPALGVSAAAPRPRTSFEDVIDIAGQLYEARIRAYPPTLERGWTHADAIVYAVDTVQFHFARFTSNDLERALRIDIGKPWTRDQDPVLGTRGPIAAETISQIGEMPMRSESDSLAATLARTRSTP